MDALYFVEQIRHFLPRTGKGCVGSYTERMREKMREIIIKPADEKEKKRQGENAKQKQELQEKYKRREGGVGGLHLWRRFCLWGSVCNLSTLLNFGMFAKRGSFHSFFFALFFSYFKLSSLLIENENLYKSEIT